MTDLFVINGPDGKGQTYRVEKDVFLVGRSANNDIQVSDGFVSRKHLKITRNEAGFFIKDLFSRNGTFVNGRLINPGVEYPLSEGLPVVIGMSVICLGKGCAEEILGFLESAKLEPMSFSSHDFDSDRPSTEPRNMDLVYKICEDLAQTLDFREMLKRVLDHVLEAFVRIERGAIILVDGETGRVKELIAKAKQGAGPLRFSREVVKRVFKRREAVMISDVQSEQAEDDLPETLKLLNIKSVMCVPLMRGSKLWGVLYADSVTKPYGFRGEDLCLLSALSTPVAAAIESARIP